MKEQITIQRFIKLFALTFTLFMSVYLEATAQRHGSNIMAGVGASYPKGFEGTIGYEVQTQYHNAWEFYGNYYLKYKTDPEAGHVTKDSFWHNYNIWSLGIAYKPCVSRGRNNHGNVRIAGFAGSDKSNFLGGGSLGYEHTFTLYNGWGVYLLVKEDFTAHSDDVFRTGGVIGVKIPLNK